MKNKEYIFERLENSVVKIYEKLYNQVKDGASIEDIEDKVDIILDALGLEYEENDSDVEIEDVEIEEEPVEDQEEDIEFGIEDYTSPEDEEETVETETEDYFVLDDEDQE